MNASSPIKAEAIIPVGAQDVGGIPDIALVIPDFEGFATLRFFSNSSQTEIGCFQAVMRNGATLSHPEAVTPVLGIFTAVAILASFLTATYGVNMAAMRTHYAHSLSVLVIFETFQSFFFSGALSVRWPSVCSAWWSNFAWASGIIYSPALMESINGFVGNGGNSSQVGGAGSVTLNNKGGLKAIYGRGVSDVAQIYSRGSSMMSDKIFNGIQMGSKLIARQVDATPTTPEEAAASASAAEALGPGYDWNGGPVFNGLPNPGNWDNFTGTLSTEGIPATDAFLTSLIWFLVAIGATVLITIGFKGLLEGMSKVKLVKTDRLATFRTHWLGYLAQITLRTALMGFFVMMTLTLYQFSIAGSPGVSAGVIAVAAIVFIIFFVGVFAVAAYACFYRTKFGRYETSPDRVLMTHSMTWKVLPGVSFTRKTSVDSWREKDQMRRRDKHIGSLPFFRVKYTYDDSSTTTNIHEDLPYIKRFGWLSARYRRTKWYFFWVWMAYQFLRACFVGGASKNPQAQVYGLFVLEIIAGLVVIKMNPFEGSRNTALAVYLLSLSKVITAGMSIAFLPEMNLARIPATVVGFVIIITQALCCIALLILIVLSAISSWFSLSRNREEFHPSAWQGLRIKYFEHLASKVEDKQKERPETPKVEGPVEPYFEVKTVYRHPKIEDEDEDHIPPAVDENGDEVGEDETSHDAINVPKTRNTPMPAAGRRSRANSRTSRNGSMPTPLGTGNLPFGARPHRQSWSSRDFSGSGWKSSQDGFYASADDGNDGTPSRREISGTHAAMRDWAMKPGDMGVPSPVPEGMGADGWQFAHQNDGGYFPRARENSRSRSRSRTRVVTPTEEQRLKHVSENFGVGPSPAFGQQDEAR